ncbi:carbon-nitrogen hydrolase family protein [Fuchsiella alkaliacetigena]|uniref:carbon-nitrogen hydrolase family protein n=1 Tax=Fuchsiella alkaliacetigena TaxID=957042 RepID=UPI00200A2D3D|nr:carbon-nitrogen hydrolase family protein [Fuchsiella alkaliacetigena]MCK8823632.1 carbon-nitrogen hydrolase family protein [Fuchsiella alkaliacetigena]
MPTKIKLAICQLKVVSTKDENLAKAEEMITKAAQARAKYIILPEMFNCPYSTDYLNSYAENIPGGKTYQFLAQQAKEHSIYLIGGSIPEAVSTEVGEKCYNTSLVFAPNGEELGRHRKVHLFDVDLEDGPTHLESAKFAAGDQVTVVKTEDLQLGLAICYDIRFPEFMRLMVDQGAEVIILPAAFNTTTGPAHWQLLLQSRAVDNQVFTVGASPARNEGADYEVYGHSMVVDPWARILAEAGSEEELLICEIDLTKVKDIRRQLPLLKHRRSDLYQINTP